MFLVPSFVKTKFHIITHVYENFIKAEDLILCINKIKDLIEESKNNTHRKVNINQ